MEEIKSRVLAWLESEAKDYNQGIFLASQVLTNKNMVFRLAKKETVDNLDKLVYELSAFYGVEYKPHAEASRAAYIEPVVPTQQAEEAPAPKFAIGEFDRELLSETINPAEEGQEEEATIAERREQRNTMLKSLPGEVQDLFFRKDNLYNERNKVSQALQDLGENPDPDSAAELTKQALELDEQIKAVDTQIQYFYRNGTIAPKNEGKAPKPELSEEVKAELGVLKKSISNKRSEISRQQSKVDANPENVQYAEKLAKLNAELKELIFKRDTLKGAAVE